MPIDVKLELPSLIKTDPAELKKDLDVALTRYAEADFDPDLKAKAIGSDIAKLFAFVRDSIRYEAYSGVLRGAYGTLAAGAANSLDRSLLLAKMLARHGVQVRFAAGDLPGAPASELYTRIFDAQTPLALDEALSNAFLKRLVTRARRDYPVIQAAIGPSSGGAAGKAREQALKDIQRHVWVQANVDGKWQDLDSSFADAVPGKSYCPARQTLDSIPKDWHQQVTIRVTAERLDGSALSTSPAFSLTAPAVDFIDQPIFLVHVAARKQGGGLGLNIGSAAAGAEEWTPALIVGNKVQSGQAINFAESGGGGLLDAFGGGDVSTFVAEWLELEIIRPDGRRDTTRRALADRATPAWRASTAHDASALRPLDRDKAGLVAPRALHNLMFSAGPHDLNAYVKNIAWSASDGNPKDDAPLAIRLFPIALINSVALIWSDHLIVPAVNDTSSVRLYADSPRIFIVSHVPTADGKMLELYDLRRDRLLGLAKDAGADSIVAERKLWFAALEGALEHETIARDAVLLNGDPSAVLSTSSQLGKDGVVTLRAPDVKTIRSQTTDADKIARLTHALDAGHTVVVPKASLTTGDLAYWEVSQEGDVRAVAGADLGGGIVSYNPIPRPPVSGGIRYDIGRPGFPGGGGGGGGDPGTGRAGTEYIGIVIVVVDLIGAVYLLQAIITQRIESARIELETDAIIQQARARQRAAGGPPR